MFFGFIILGSWESFATSFQFALLNGGPASMFYGGFLACMGEGAVAFSLAELASMCEILLFVLERSNILK